MQTKFISLELEGGGMLLTKPHRIESILYINNWVYITIGNKEHRYRGSLKDLQEKIQAYDSTDKQ